MTKRSDIITVDIERPLHEKLTKSADAKNISLRKFVNETLRMDVEKIEFMSRIAPKLSMIEAQSDSILIRDESAKKTRFAQIVIRNEKLWCDLDDSHECEHVRYALTLPELINLKDKLKKL